MSFLSYLPIMESMNKKLMIIPTIVLSSALLLTGCTSGKTEPGKVGSPNPTSSSSSTSTDPAVQPTGNVGYVAPPSDLNEDYKGYYYGPTTLAPESWEYFKSTGAKTYKEDPSIRSTTANEWDKARTNDTDLATFDKLYGEVSSDVEQSALNISTYLEQNKDESVDNLTNNKELVINRYSNLGTTTVEKDTSTGFYFVIFKLNGGSAKGAPAYGILVPQKGITPDFFDAPASP